MNTAITSAQKTGGFPLQRPSTRKNKVHQLTDTQYNIIAEELARLISERKCTDNILVGNRFFDFDTKIDQDSKAVFSGVEFLGVRESSYETVFTLRGLKLVGAYTLSGNPVKVNVDCERLASIVRKYKMVSNE